MPWGELSCLSLIKLWKSVCNLETIPFDTIQKSLRNDVRWYWYENEYPHLAGYCKELYDQRRCAEVI